MDVAVYVISAIFVASLGYVGVAIYCVLRFKSRLSGFSGPEKERPGVTLYKPLHGPDYELHDNLLSFCEQNYPTFQIVFGVSDANDPAVPIVRDIMSARPDIDMELVINTISNGNNPKISNLINMDTVAKHDVLIISDSDMRVPPDYIDRVVQGFDGDRVGLVTCLYKGTPAPGLASHLGAMFINQWFTPSALIPATFGGMQHCFGATMAIKRDVLDEIGGLAALVGNLADDYTLGRLVRKAGYEVRLASVAVENIVEETDLKSLILHELRWARTIRSVEPLGFLSTFVTDTLPLGLILSLLMVSSGYGWAWVAAPVGAAGFARILLHFSTKVAFSSKQPISIWIIPVRDVLSLLVRLLCFTGRTVNWRNSELSVDKGGEINTMVSRKRVDNEYEKDTVPESPVL